MDSSVAEAKKEQVLIRTISASSGVSTSENPCAKSKALMRSVSTSFFAHPKVTKRMFFLSIVGVLEGLTILLLL